MRMIFGVLSLLIALAIMGTIAKKQLQSISSSGVSTRVQQAGGGVTAPAAAGDRDGATLGIPGGMPGAVAADPGGLTVGQQARNLQQQVQQDTERALQQGVDRNKGQ